MPAIDPNIWDSLRALEAAGAPGFLQDLVREFLNTAPERLNRLKRAFEVGDSGALEREAHAFKSSCGTLGAKAAATSLDELERLGREKRAGAAANALAALERDLEAASAELRRAAGVR